MELKIGLKKITNFTSQSIHKVYKNFKKKKKIEGKNKLKIREERNQVSSRWQSHQLPRLSSNSNYGDARCKTIVQQCHSNKRGEVHDDGYFKCSSNDTSVPT